jgi:inner membrane protein YidH
VAGPVASDDSRRTWLASERTWLAWWRSGIAVGAVAIAVGRLLPAVTSGERWAFRVLGLGYGVLSVAILLVGAVRQRRSASALRRGSFEELTSPLVAWLTAGGVALSVGVVILVISAL